MPRRLGVVALLFLLAAVPTARADDERALKVLDTPAVRSVAASLGGLSLAYRSPTLDKTKALVRETFWAASGDADLNSDERARETAKFDAMWDELFAVTSGYKVEQVAFLGVDLVVPGSAMDLYFGATTPRGPVVIRYSVMLEVKGKTRLRGIEVITGWEKVKAATAAITVKADPTRLVIFKDPPPSDASRPE